MANSEKGSGMENTEEGRGKVEEEHNEELKKLRGANQILLNELVSLAKEREIVNDELMNARCGRITRPIDPPDVRFAKKQKELASIQAEVRKLEHEKESLKLMIEEYHGTAKKYWRSKPKTRDQVHPRKVYFLRSAKSSEVVTHGHSG